MLTKYLFVVVISLSLQTTAQTVRPISLNELLQRVNSGNDTTYIINFWATWCAPCLEELPSFEKLSDDYQNKTLKVLLVSVDFRSKLETTVVPFLRNRGLRNEVFLLDETDQQEYINRIDPNWSGAIPATLFIHRKKRSFFEKEFTYDELLTEYKKIQ
jgi:thiol-disulfide isomerase/thioredoxin